MFNSNASSADAGGANYIEDVFSTYLYTGNSSTQTITNGIDLAGEGGMVWVKQRDVARSNFLTDTLRGAGYSVTSNDTAAQAYDATRLTSFNSTGFSVGASSNFNNSGQTYASWTFRKQPKFFDVVTYTGTGSATTIAHSLGSVPGCIITKKTSAAGDDWAVYHRSTGASAYLTLNTTDASNATSTGWNDTAPTSTVFSLGTSSLANASGATYVAYLFAHDAGGFGLTGTDNVISCGSYTGNGSETNGTSVTLGYEPQWLLVKAASTTADWFLVDNMRGWGPNNTGQASTLKPNSSAAESANAYNTVEISSTGFKLHSTSDDWNGSGRTYIYIAIRRGPMKVPTDATKVFKPSYGLNGGANGKVWDAGFPTDMYIRDNPASSNFYTSDRLRGSVNYLLTNTTGAEASLAYSDKLDNNVGVYTTTAYDYTTWIAWMFRRAPSFFDEVCYNGAASAQTLTHNLGAAPELMIVRCRNTASMSWEVYHKDLGASKHILLNDTALAQTSSAYWNDVTPTSTQFTVGTSGYVNYTGRTYVAYLFATCAGVSKVGSYTGTATTQQINCGFTAGARFVLIKRTDSTGDWYVYDSARGIVAGNDPYLLLNSTAAEVTSTDYVDTYAAGFELTSTAPAALNASGGTYIFLAIA